MPSGTSSNEALHSEVKGWFLQTQQLHQSTLQLKLKILQAAKLLPHYAALRFPTLSQASCSILLARCVGNDVWTTDAWRAWCLENYQASVAKAVLPLSDRRKSEVTKVKEWVRKKPATAAQHQKSKRKRTVFTQERTHKVRRQGVRASHVET